jgi:hypothetical protein
LDVVHHSQCALAIYWSFSPATLPFRQQMLEQRRIATLSHMVSSARIPMTPLLVIAARMCNAEVPQVVCAAETAWQNMLNCRPIAFPLVKAYRAATDEAAPDPKTVFQDKCGISLRNAPHQISM